MTSPRTAFEALPAWLAAGIVLLGGLLWWMQRTVPLDGSITSSAEGVFVADGIVPSRLGSPDGSRYWSSWQDDDANTGQLQLGPYPAPRTLGFYLAGYPQLEGNRLFFEQANTGELWEPELANPGEAWSPVVVDLPPGWLGNPLVIHAVDDAHGVHGWLGLAEPFAAVRSAWWWNGALRKLGVFVFVGLVVGLAATGASSACRVLGFTFEPALLLVSCALLTISGYGIFWLTWLNATLGAVAAWLELLAAGGLAFWRECGSAAVWRRRDWRLPALLMLGGGVFFVSGLLLFSVERPMSALAETRFVDSLPADNILPQRFAERLAQDLSPKHLIGGWRSSDRPPLQAGWTLLLMRPARALGVDYDTVGQCAGVWFQLLWIPGVWLWLRSLKTRPGVATVIVSSLLPTGFLFLNTAFVWPKLGAAALVLGAFALWFLVSDDELARPVRYAVGGGLAGLGWLSHGGVAFALLALVPFVLWSWRQRGWVRPWVLAAVCFSVLVAPWLAYQKWYEPPGNQLVRWHLAGDQSPEKRSTWKSLASAYSRISFQEWWRNRQANVHMLFAGEWRSWWVFDFSNGQARRNGESFVFSCMGWWNAGLLVLLFPLLIRPLRRPWPRELMDAHFLSVGWVLLTLVIWVLLMFVGGTTLIHQGSYTTLLVLLPMFALAVWRLYPLLFVAVAAAQAWGFVSVWLMVPPHWASASMRLDAAVICGLAVTGCLGLAIREIAADRQTK